jgi:hypothetical protein
MFSIRSFVRWLRSHADLAFVVVNTDDWLLCAQPSSPSGSSPPLRVSCVPGFTLNDVRKLPPWSQQTYTGWVIDGVRMCIRLTPTRKPSLVREFLAITGSAP